MSLKAGIYILDAPYFIDRCYSYFIPSEYEEKTVPGSIVEVPFGVSNRKMTGVVVSTEECPEEEELKPILTPDGNFPPFLSESALKLCSFLKKRTLCTFGEAVRTVIPPAALSKMALSYMPSDIPEGKAKNLSKMLSDKSAFVYSFILSNGNVPYDRLKSKFGDGINEVLDLLLKEKLIEKSKVLKEGGSNVKTVTKVFPSEGDGQTRPILKSEKQKFVYDTVLKSPGLTLEELAFKTALERSSLRSTVTSLEKKNAVYCIREDVFRNSFLPDISAAESSYSRDFSLTEEQSDALETLSSLYNAHSPKAALLHGVTGSGKTNVILKLIDRVLEDGKNVIMMIPEIALTPQTVERFAVKYGENIAVIHSSLSAGERFDAWRRIREGKARVIIGTRSAVMAPVVNLGLIVIDEEHEHTYKSDTNPKYYTHDVAAFRCKEENAMLLLASATPSVTSYRKAERGSYTLVRLKNRFGSGKLPEVEVSDMRAELASGNSLPLSTSLINRISADLNDGKQTILFLNRRGFNNYVTCRNCGESIKCPSCSLTMTYHIKSDAVISLEKPDRDTFLQSRQSSGYLQCHMCGHREPLPSECPSCHGKHLNFLGYGTQLVENALRSLFPNAKIARMDFDSTQKKNSHKDILDSFRNGEADILLGTQMVTKGHDFPGVRTVGVLNADSSLFVDDYRANERTFSMLTQVTGRAGRSDSDGFSVIQTFNPGSDIISLASKQDYESFYKTEIRLRKALTLPPFCDIAVITLSCNDETKLAASAEKMKEYLTEKITSDKENIRMYINGPFEAQIYKVHNVCRMKFFIKCSLDTRTRDFFSSLLCGFSASLPGGRSDKAVHVSIDFNPTSI